MKTHLLSLVAVGVIAAGVTARPHPTNILKNGTLCTSEATVDTAPAVYDQFTTTVVSVVTVNIIRSTVTISGDALQNTPSTAAPITAMNVKLFPPADHKFGTTTFQTTEPMVEHYPPPDHKFNRTGRRLHAVESAKNTPPADDKFDPAPYRDAIPQILPPQDHKFVKTVWIDDVAAVTASERATTQSSNTIPTSVEVNFFHSSSAECNSTTEVNATTSNNLAKKSASSKSSKARRTLVLSVDPVVTSYPLKSRQFGSDYKNLMCRACEEIINQCINVSWTFYC